MAADLKDERFLDRPVGDLILYGFVMGIRRAIPNTSEETCVKLFLREVGQLIGNPSPKAMLGRVQRMNVELIEAKKTDAT